MANATTGRSFFQRLLGVCATRPPADGDAWSFDGQCIAIDLDRTPELETPPGAVRLEGNGLPERVLVVRTAEGYRAFRNRCTHAGRRLDPLPDGEAGDGCQSVQCCSVGKSTFDLEGQVLSGSAKSAVATFPTQTENRTLTVTLHVAM